MEQVSALLRPVVLFDLDGTLANTIPLIVASHQHAFRTVLGEEIDEKTARGWIGMTLKDTFAEFPAETSAELEREYLVHNRSHLRTHTLPYPGVNELVADLKAAGAQLGIVTSKRRESAVPTLESVGLDGEVGMLVTVENVQRHKPHPDPLLFALEHMGADPADALYVGDAVVDIKAARAAGMLSVAVTWGAATPEDLGAQQPDFLATTVDELRHILFTKEEK